MTRYLYTQEFGYHLKIAEELIQQNIKIKKYTNTKSKSIIQAEIEIQKNINSIILKLDLIDYMDIKTANKSEEKYFQMMLEKNKKIQESIRKYQNKGFNREIPIRSSELTHEQGLKDQLEEDQLKIDLP